MPYLDFSTVLVSTDWSQQCVHSYWERAGFSRDKQRWRCQRCGKSEMRPRERRRKEEIVRVLAQCFMRGDNLWTARQAARVNCYYAAKWYNAFRRHTQ
jgi:transposase-like protein